MRKASRCLLLLILLLALTACASQPTTSPQNVASPAEAPQSYGCASAEEALDAYLRAMRSLDADALINVTQMGDEYLAYGTEERFDRYRETYGVRQGSMGYEQAVKSTHDKYHIEYRAYIYEAFADPEKYVSHITTEVLHAMKHTITSSESLDVHNKAYSYLFDPYPVTGAKRIRVGYPMTRSSGEYICMSLGGKWYVNDPQAWHFWVHLD